MRAGHTPIPRYRGQDGPAILAQGFRPFFMLAGLWAVFALVVSVAAFQGLIELPGEIDPIAWHAHELLFGFVAASIAGFLLTAIPNWTGHLPLQGMPLLFLVVLWAVGRAALLLSESVGPVAAAALDLAFLAAMVAVALREIVAGRNWRNLPVVALITLLLFANALFHAEALELIEADGIGRRLAIATILTLITLIGGRVVPSFTRNWLVKRNVEPLPAAFGPFDKVTLVVTIATLLLWVAVPEDMLSAAFAGLAAVLNAVRLLRWRGYATSAEALLWVLHLGYAWIPVGLALLALSHWWTALPQSGALHALTAGAMGTMTLAVMSRAILGHTGRELTAGPGLVAAYLLITVAVAGRVASAVLDDFHTPLLWLAAVSWVGAFVAFLSVCGPMVVRRRSDGKPG